MKVQQASNGCYFVEIGAKLIGGRVTAQRFDLGMNLGHAQRKARLLWSLWLTQDGCWTEEGLRKGREIAKERRDGHEPYRFT